MLQTWRKSWNHLMSVAMCRVAHFVLQIARLPCFWVEWCSLSSVFGVWSNIFDPIACVRELTNQRNPYGFVVVIVVVVLEIIEKVIQTIQIENWLAYKWMIPSCRIYCVLWISTTRHSCRMSLREWLKCIWRVGECCMDVTKGELWWIEVWGEY